MQLNNHKSKQPNLKHEERIWKNIFFSKVDKQMANKHINNAQQITSEMQVKATMIYHLILIRMAIIKR